MSCLVCIQHPLCTDSTTNEFLSLPHPRSLESASYALTTNDKLLEVQCISTTYRSWFLDNSVISDGGIYTMTPVDPVFIALALIESRTSKLSGNDRPMFLTLEDILSNERYPDFAKLEPSLVKSAKQVCNVQEISPGVFVYRFDSDKTLKWLQSKVQKLLTKFDTLKLLHFYSNVGLSDESGGELNADARNARIRTILRIMSEYISKERLSLLSASYDLSLAEKEAVFVISPLEYNNMRPSKSDEGKATDKKRKMSNGQRTLSKANIKGMNPLTNFFTKK